MNFPQLLEVKAIEKYKLHLSYNDGITGIVNLSDVAGKGVFAYWDEAHDNFFKVFVNPIGKGITWNDDLDICPDAAYLEITGQTFEEWRAKNISHATA